MDTIKALYTRDESDEAARRFVGGYESVGWERGTRTVTYEGGTEVPLAQLVVSQLFGRPATWVDVEQIILYSTKKHVPGAMRIEVEPVVVADHEGKPSGVCGHTYTLYQIEIGPDARGQRHIEVPDTTGHAVASFLVHNYTEYETMRDYMAAATYYATTESVVEGDRIRAERDNPCECPACVRAREMAADALASGKRVHVMATDSTHAPDPDIPVAMREMAENAEGYERYPGGSDLRAERKHGTPAEIPVETTDPPVGM